MTTLYLRDEYGLVEQAAIVDGTVDAEAAPTLAALVAWAKSGGQTAEDLDQYFNGYMMVTTDPAQGWPEEQPA